MYEVVDASTETNEPFPTLKVRWSSPSKSFPLLDQSKDWNNAKIRFYCIDWELKTKIPDGEYDTVFLRLAAP